MVVGKKQANFLRSGPHKARRRQDRYNHIPPGTTCRLPFPTEPQSRWQGWPKSDFSDDSLLWQTYRECTSLADLEQPNQTRCGGLSPLHLAHARTGPSAQPWPFLVCGAGRSPFGVRSVEKRETRRSGRKKKPACCWTPGLDRSLPSRRCPGLLRRPHLCDDAVFHMTAMLLFIRAVARCM